MFAFSLGVVLAGAVRQVVAALRNDILLAVALPDYREEAGGWLPLIALVMRKGLEKAHEDLFIGICDKYQQERDAGWSRPADLPDCYATYEEWQKALAEDQEQRYPTE